MTDVTALPAVPDRGPAKRPGAPRRDASGRILPGTVLNPSGRPKVWREFREAMRERTPAAVGILDAALASDDPALFTWAVDKVLGYAWGRPPQRVQVAGDDEAAPVRVEHAFDLTRLAPEHIRSLREIARAMRREAADG